MAKRKTNIQLVNHMMNYSNYGAMSQMFIMNAIKSAADATAATDPANYPKDSMVAPEAWVGVAKEIKETMEKEWAK